MHLIETGGPGGAEKMLLSMIQELDKRGSKVEVILVKHGWLNDELKAMGFECRVFPLHGQTFLAWFFRLIRTIKREKFDVIHSHEFFMNCVGFALGRLLGIRTIGTVHGKSYYADKKRRIWFYKIVAQFGQLIAVSQDVRTYLKRIGIPENKVYVIPNGIDVAKFRHKDSDRVAARNQLKVAENNKLIVCVGNLYPVKGHVFLIRAMPEILKAVPDARLVLAGRGECEAEIKKEARKLEIANSICLLGFVGDIYPVLLAADIFVQPSLSEGMPLAVLEAMSCEKPVVATAVGGMGEIISSGKNGLLVPPKDSNAIADAVINVLTNDELSHEIARQGKTLVENEFSLRKMTDRYLAVYDRQEIPS